MRIRTIKPEFWEDEKVGPMRTDTRLAFIWLWGAADDEGRLANLNAARLRSAAFAYHDDVTLSDAQRMIDDLQSAGRLVPYVVDGQRFAFIPNFKRHQNVNRPTPSRIPAPPVSPPAVVVTAPVVLTEDSVRTQGSLTAGREGKGREVGREEIISKASPSHSGRPEGMAARVQDVFDHWKSTMGHPRAQLDAKRKTTIGKALAAYSVDDCKQAIIGCSLTPHNMGQNDRNERYDGIDLILRDAAHIDRFMANATTPPEVRPARESSAVRLARRMGIFNEETGGLDDD